VLVVRESIKYHKKDACVKLYISFEQLSVSQRRTQAKPVEDWLTVGWSIFCRQTLSSSKSSKILQTLTAVSLSSVNAIALFTSFPAAKRVCSYAGDPRHHLRLEEKHCPFPEDYLPVKVRCATSPYVHYSQVLRRHLYAAAVTRLYIRWIQLFRIIYCIYIGYWYIVMRAVYIVDMWNPSKTLVKQSCNVGKHCFSV